MSHLSCLQISAISYDGVSLPYDELCCEIPNNKKILIGRGATNELVLEDPSRIISRVQASVLAASRDSVEVTNLSSSTSFFINTFEVRPGESKIIGCGDSLLIGAYVLQLSLVTTEKLKIPKNSSQMESLLDASPDKDFIASGFIPDDVDFYSTSDRGRSAISSSLRVNDGGSLQELASSEISLLQNDDTPVEVLLGHLLKIDSEEEHEILANSNRADALLSGVKQSALSSTLLADTSVSIPRSASVTEDNIRLYQATSHNKKGYVQSQTGLYMDECCRIAFASALQIDVKKLPAFTPDFFQQLGDVLLHLTAGTVNMMHERAQIKHEMRAEVTIIAPSGNNPLKFAPDAHAAITHLLGEPIPGFMPAKTAIDDAFDDLLAHQIGLMSGARAAVYDVVKNFSPEKIQKYLATKNIIESLMPMAKKARLWELYEAHYGEVAGNAREEFEMRFQQAFAQAYENEIDKMCEARGLV